MTVNTVELLHKGRRVASHRSQPPTRQPHHGGRAHARGSSRPGRVDAAAARSRWAGKDRSRPPRRWSSTSWPRACIRNRAFAVAWASCGWANASARSRLEAACRRALALGAHAYKNVEAILKNDLDRKPLPPRNPGTCPRSITTTCADRTTTNNPGGPAPCCITPPLKNSPSCASLGMRQAGVLDQQAMSDIEAVELRGTTRAVARS